MPTRTLLLSAVLLVGCSSVGTLTPASPRDSLLDADRALGVMNRPTAATVGIALTDDALVLVPGEPVRRGAEARALLARMPNYDANVRWRPGYADVSRDGTRGWTTGFAEMSGVGVDSARRHAAYAAWWRREASGAWRIVAYIRNPAPPLVDTAAVLAASAPAPATPGGQTVSPELVLQADRDFARMGAAEGPRAAFVAWVADDAVAWGRTGLDRGPAVRDGLRQGFQGNPTFEWAPIFGDIAGSGDLGMTIGEARIVTPASANAPERTSFSKYFSVWKRQPDGSWKWVFDTGNPRPIR